MSNILIFLDMSSKHVHFYSEIEFHIKDLTRQKAKTRSEQSERRLFHFGHPLEVREPDLREDEQSSHPGHLNQMA